MNRKKVEITRKPFQNLTGLLIFFIALSACKQEPVDLKIKTLSLEDARVQAATVESMVKPELHEDFQLSVWATDSLVADPISMRFDSEGRLFYSRTNRRKISEFDIRSHQDWEIQSIKMQSVADRKSFIHEELSPENSAKNKWLPDINGDGSHDWKDLTVEKENIYRLEDTDGSGLADLAQLVVEDFHDEVTDVAGAVLFHEGELFVGVAPDLWKLTDTNGDGLMDTKVSLMHGFGVHIGFGGHNMSGLTVGPEGKIYWGIGDIGFSGTDATGKKWHFPNEGVVVRCNTDGSDFEVFAHGVRNTHEFVFDEFANLISVDNDGDHSGERERIVYLVNGSDTGWRINWQFGKYRDPDNNNYKVWMDENMATPNSPDKAAYYIPTIANYVNGPTGMLYNPGTALGPKWQNTFFVAEFAGNPARSGIHGFKLKPKGAGFELVKTEQLMGGILATGMDFGPDGALYFSDWIDGWVNKGYGRIWKMDLTQGAFTAERENTAELIRQNFHDKEAVQLGKLLGHADQRIRRKAQFALAKKGNEGVVVFKEQLSQKENRMSRIHAIWGLSQIAGKDEQVGAELIPFLKDSDEEIRAQAAKWIGDIRLSQAGKDLLSLLKDSNSRVRFFAAEALGRIEYAGAVDPLIQMLEENNDSDVYLRHAGSLALARIGNVAPIVNLKDHPSKAVRTAAVLALRRMGHAGVAEFLNDSEEYIVAEAARAINDDLSIPDALPALAGILTTTKFSSEPIIRRAINANLRVGNEQCMNNLISYLSNAQVPKAMKIEAMEALGTWAKPSVLDRVDGRFRGEIERDPNPLRLASKDVIMELLAASDEEIRIAAVRSIAKLNISDASDRLFAMLEKDPSPGVREASLVGITTMKEVPVDKAIESALSDAVLSVRVAGLGLIEQLEISEQLKANLLADVIVKQTVEEKQAALLSLGKLDLEQAKPVFENVLNLLEAEKLAPEIELELIEALENLDEPSLTARYNEIRSNRSGDDLLASYSGSMYGGDPQRGRRIMFQHPTGQCIKCHSYDDFGGNAGPRLNGIGSQLSRKELLEALIDPSKRLAPGFGVVILDLKDDQKLAGILAAENNNSVTVKMGNKPDTVVLKEHIVLRNDAPSSMPDMKQYLDRREIRDLVSYLATLK
ncbi:HEAT repeat domain-containing protein [Lunatibacter salilacus]|uniref:HEAT repeat domain-containing protein n=1 Tax=Lunatibacter salilacus TaxID=2483804 RepID=UPI00131EB349|nr:HEAT repeat domain-containing protein [Lunatibacter salilacus]